MKILIKNIDVLETVTQGRHNNIDILINDNVIEKIEKNIPSLDVDREIDASGLVCLPGFVNTHHHFYQTFTRNLPPAQNVELFDWLKFHYPVWEKYDREDIYVSAKVALAEMMLTGVTTTTDHLYLYNSAAAGGWIEEEIQAAQELGVRFYPTRGSMSLSVKDGGLPPDSVVQTEEKIMQHIEEVVAKFHNVERYSMLRISLAPCSPFSVTGKLMKMTAEYAKKNNLLIHTHVAETADEEQFCIEKFGNRPYYYLKDMGWAESNAWYAHCVHLNDEELKDMALNGVGVAHCPSSNMRLGSGIARISKMLELGVKVSLAVDGSASNDASDFLGEMRQMLLLSRVGFGASSMKTMDVIRTATMGGAQVLHWADDIGSLEVGKAADLNLWSLDDISYAGAQSDPVAALIFSGRNHEARYVMVNGEITVENGRLTKVDQDELREEAFERSSALWKRAGVV